MLLMFAWRFVAGLASLAVIATVIGCGDSRPTRVQVRGRVTYNGKPATCGTVCFIRKDAGEGGFNRPATAEVGPDGSYVMKTFGKDDGVLPGEYAVTITAVDYAHAVDANRGDGRTMSKQEIQAQLLLPIKYRSLDTSPLKASVPADARGPLQIDFDLKD